MVRYPPQEFHVTHRVTLSLAVLLLLSTAEIAIAQNLPDVSNVQDLPSTTPVSPKYERLTPLSIHRLPDFLNEGSPLLKSGQAAATPFRLAHVKSVVNFQGSFTSRGKTWPFTMIGTPPSAGAFTSVP